MKPRTRYLVRRAMPFVFLAPAALVALGAVLVQGAFHVGRFVVGAGWILLVTLPVAGWIAWHLGSPALDEQRQIALRIGYGPASDLFRRP